MHGFPETPPPIYAFEFPLGEIVALSTAEVLEFWGMLSLDLRKLTCLPRIPTAHNCCLIVVYQCVVSCPELNPPTVTAIPVVPQVSKRGVISDSFPLVPPTPI